jgi:uncharacterized protein YgiM (DUF1202 family)
MRKSMYALAIFALAIGCAPILPMQKPILPMQTPTALAIKTKLPMQLPTEKSALAIVTASQSLNVRVRPGEKSAVTGYLYNGNAVTLTNKCSKGWAQIVWKSATAWVKARFLSENKCQTREEK